MPAQPSPAQPSGGVPFATLGLSRHRLLANSSGKQFATFHGQEYNVIIPWLIPITHAEAHYVFAHGWRAFEDLLLEQDPDLVRLERPSIV